MMGVRWQLATAGALAVVGLAAGPARAAVVINEVESDDPVVADFVELTNNGAAAVSIAGYVIKDSDDGHAFVIPNGTTLDPGHYYVADVDSGAGGFGLGSSDAARLFAPGDLNNPIDGHSWTSHAAVTYGRCPDGTGAFTGTLSSTRGAANACPVAADPWPGSAAIAFADDANVFGQNLSGLAYQASGTSARGVLWAVRNNASTLFRLVFAGGRWTPDASGGWGAGKTLVYPNGSGVPDAEGVTQAGGDGNGMYVSTERNDDGANSNTSRPSVLRYDVTAAGGTLTATQEWNLTADLPGLAPNAGLEAIAWVPDSLLVSKGFVDDSTGANYDPARYPDHGAGLFFVGVEQNGQIVAYALKGDGTYRRVATIASGFPAVMDLSYEPETTHLWAVCDNNCDGRTATLDVAGNGHFAVTHTYARPGGMSNLNNEGFAIAPQAECVNGLKPTFYSDDSNDDQHALRTGSINCTALQPAPTPTATVQPAPQPTATPAPPAPDRTAPSLKLSLKVSKTGSFAVRRTGRLGMVFTLGEKASLSIQVTARRNARAKARTILKATRAGVAAGTTTLKLSLSRAARRSLRKGETLTLTVQARDAAGNARTVTAKAKVP